MPFAAGKKRLYQGIPTLFNVRFDEQPWFDLQDQ